MPFILKRFALLLPFILWSLYESAAQTQLQYYLPDDLTYDENIPTPRSVIGHEIGDWHITHDKLVYYYLKLAEVSPKVKVESIGKTYEDRPLLNVIITSEQNHEKLEQLRLDHLKLSDPSLSDDVDIETMPVVVRLGYSIHGNEASGANASLLVAYYLAAAQGKENSDILEKCIILIDPSLNPDGLQRYSSWVNEHKSMNLNSDPNGREFNESWPNGRTNHYWFDLNRDWLLAQHPESIGRLKSYHEWRPNIQTDHHEMGSESTFFFQPGIPSRKHPLIPMENVSLTEKIARYHAKALDDENRLYYTKESFDDFYFGKGSTYPDIHGSIGILFEQASVRGHLRKTQHGELPFAFSIKNQFISSLSTIDAAYDLRTELLSFQKNFYKDASPSKSKYADRAFIFGTNHDVARTVQLAEVLLRHQIKIYKPAKDITIDGKRFFTDNSFIIPLDQPQNKLIDAIFERRIKFQDSLFYDVSAWSFDLAYNVNFATVEKLSATKIMGSQIADLDMPKGEILGDGKLAYVVEWDQYYAPGFLNALLQEGFRVKVATEPFVALSGEKFVQGSLLIPIGIQDLEEDKLLEALSKYSKKYHVKIHSIASGQSSMGPDLGSNRFIDVHKPHIAMIVGPGASGSETGEAWHLLDQRYDMKATMISSEMTDQIKLNEYNVILLPGGYYSSLNGTAQENIKEWVKDGGTLIACRDALRFVAKLQIADLKFKKAVSDTTSKIPYVDISKKRGAQVIGGAIYKIEIDNTHPLAYGYDQTSLAVFKRGTLALETSKNSNANPFIYTENPLLSGYSSRQNIENIQGTPAVSISSFGQGKVIAFVDDHNFRAFWYGTNRLFMNSIFFGNQIDTR